MKTDKELVGAITHNIILMLPTENEDVGVVVRVAREDADRLSRQLRPYTVEGAYWIKPGTAEIEMTRSIE